MGIAIKGETLTESGDVKAGPEDEPCRSGVDVIGTEKDSVIELIMVARMFWITSPMGWSSSSSLGLLLLLFVPFGVCALPLSFEPFCLELSLDIFF